MRRLITILSFVALFTCGGCVWPSERSCYDVARKTVMADKDFPKDGKILPIDKCKLYIMKSAGKVVIFYDHTESGRIETDSYDVWLKRIARTWELDYYNPTPKYQQ